MQKIQLEVNEHIGVANFFQIKFLYRKPPFSFYYCDNYASISYYINVPSADAPQLVVSKAQKSEYISRQREAFDLSWKKSLFIPNNYAERTPVNIQVIKDFKIATISRDSEEVYNKLKKISKLSEQNVFNVVELVNYLELNYHDDKETSDRHVNIFGTGGDDDKRKTINISTISSILASHFYCAKYGINESLCVKKIGTLNVTCNVGSQQFYDALASDLVGKRKKFNSLNESSKKYLDFNPSNQSKYLPLLYFGYIYHNFVKNIRKDRIRPEALLDIYKLIFPTANLTNYSAVVNGISSTEYFHYYDAVYREKGKTGIIVHNSNGVDELFKDHNTIEYYKNGISVHTEHNFVISVSNIPAYDRFYSESTVEEHTQKFYDLFKPNFYSKEIKETICYNVALIAQLYYLINNDYSQENNSNKEDLSKERLVNLKDEVFDFFFEESKLK